MSANGYLSRELAAVDGYLGDGERVLATEPSSLGFGGPGILVVTDRRLMHLYFRRITRRLRMTSHDLRDITNIEAQSLGKLARINVTLQDGVIAYFTTQSRANASRLVKLIQSMEKPYVRDS